MKYKIKNSIRSKNEKERIKAILQTRNIKTGELFFKKGLSPEKIAKELTGTIYDPSDAYVDEIKNLCSELETEKEIELFEDEPKKT